MFERNIIQQLTTWKTTVNRKPLLIHGARQVGKTWVLKYFGREYFEDVAYFSLDKDESGLCDISEPQKTPSALLSNCLSYMEEKLIHKPLY